jgi:hypothetical protein
LSHSVCLSGFLSGSAWCGNPRAFGLSSRQLLTETFREAVNSNLNVMRAFAHGVSPQYAIQTSPGVYNEAMFRGLDFVLDAARQHGIKVGSAAAHIQSRLALLA